MASQSSGMPLWAKVLIGIVVAGAVLLILIFLAAMLMPVSK